MSRISSEKAVNQVGNRFDLILIASKRVRELRNGHRPKLQTKAGPVVTALEEIEAMLTRTLNTLDPEIKDVDFVVDINSVVELVQPETDKLLGKL